MSEIKAGAILNYIRLFISLGIGFFLSPFILASLGKAEYGIYTIAGTIIGWLALCDFGLTASTTKFLSEYQAKGDKDGEAHYLGNVAALFSVIGGIVLVAGLSIYPFLGNIFPKFNEEELELYRVLYLMTLFNTALMFPARSLGGISASRQKYKIPGIVGTAMSLASTTGTIVVLFMGYKSIALCAVSIAFGILGMLWNVYYCFGILKARMSWNGWDIPLCKSMFTVSIWMFLQQLVSSFNYNCGSMIVGATSGPAEISVYSYGHSLMAYFFMLSNCISGLYLPRIVKIVQDQKSSISILSDLMVQVGRYHVIILLLPLLGIIFLGKDFFDNWIGATMGDDTVVSWMVAAIMTATLFPMLVQCLAWQIMIAKNLLKYQVRVTIISALVMLLAGYFLTIYYGSIGMAISSTCSTAISFVSLWLLYSKRIGLPMLHIYQRIYKGIFLPTLFLFGIVLIIQRVAIPYSGWFAFVCKAVLLTIMYIFLMVKLYFTETEKNLIPSPIRKILN